MDIVRKTEETFSQKCCFHNRFHVVIEFFGDEVPMFYCKKCGLQRTLAEIQGRTGLTTIEEVFDRLNKGNTDWML
jgi:hypothetical protein